MTPCYFAAFVCSIDKYFSGDRDAPAYLYVKLYCFRFAFVLFFSFYNSSSVRNCSYIVGGIFNTGTKYFILCECLCEISGSRRDVTEAFALVGCYVAYVGSWLPPFEGGTGSLSCTVSNQPNSSLLRRTSQRSRSVLVFFFSFNGMAEFSVLLEYDAVSLVTWSWIFET